MKSLTGEEEFKFTLRSTGSQCREELSFPGSTQHQLHSGPAGESLTTCSGGPIGALAHNRKTGTRNHPAGACKPSCCWKTISTKARTGTHWTAGPCNVVCVSMCVSVCPTGAFCGGFCDGTSSQGTSQWSDCFEGRLQLDPLTQSSQYRTWKSKGGPRSPRCCFS